MSNRPRFTGFLVLPHMRIQNVNAISSPLTWGFPAMSGFLGFMWNLERRLNSRYQLGFTAIGIICHDFAPRVAKPSYEYRFSLTRNPTKEDGKPPEIIEEGRAYLDVTLVLGVIGSIFHESQSEQKNADIASAIWDIASSMRICGGTVIPSDRIPVRQPALYALDGNLEERRKNFRSQRHQFVPGFTLISRDNLLERRFQQLSQGDPSITRLDAWMDVSRLNYRAQKRDADNKSGSLKAIWEPVGKDDWLVPIPVGYGALSDLYVNSQVAATRDSATSFRFVESLYSIGQWISPHRLNDPTELLWYPSYDAATGVYRCRNENSLDAEEMVSVGQNKENI